MSNFSSVVHKSTKRFAPKVPSRRNAAAEIHSNTGSGGLEFEKNLESDALKGISPQVSPSTIAKSSTPSFAEQYPTPATESVDVAEGTRASGASDDLDEWPDHTTTFRTTRRQQARSQLHTPDIVVPAPEPTVPSKTAAKSRGLTGGAVSSPRSDKAKRRSTKRLAEPAQEDVLDITPGYIAAPNQDGEELEGGTENLPRKRQKRGEGRAQRASTRRQAENGIAREIQETPITNGAAVEAAENDATPPDQTIQMVQEKKRTRHTGQRAKTNNEPLNILKAKQTKIAMQDAAAAVVAAATGDAPAAPTAKAGRTGMRRRTPTPENAEEHEIAPAQVTMSELCRDTRLGKKSTREADLEKVDWKEVNRKRKEVVAPTSIDRGGDSTNALTDSASQLALVPKMTIRNGQIVVDEESRQVDRHADVIRDAEAPTSAQEVTDITRRVNQSTIGRQAGVRKYGSWDEEATDLFYKGLRMFGTDFMMISKMFPDMSRRHIKLKYTREERANLARVHEALQNREDVNLEEFSKMTNQEYGDPTKVYDELEAEEAKLHAEDKARRARDAEQGDEADEPIADDRTLHPRERGATDHSADGTGEVTASNAELSAKKNRFASIARDITNAATAPKKPKKLTALARKRERKGKKGLDGTEEVVGPIGEVNL